MKKYKNDVHPFYHTKDLVEDLSKELGLSLSASKIMVEAFYMIVEREILVGHKVSVTGLGQIFIRRPETHTGHNIAKKVQVPIDPDNLVLKFYPDPDVYFAVEGSAPSTDDIDELE